MKTAVLIFHKNILSKYEPQWIIDCLKSIKKQTFQKFDLIELNYGNDELQIGDLGFFDNHKKYYYEEYLNNHVKAMNYLLNKAFNKLKYDNAIIINLDDVYDGKRFEKQLDKIKEGYGVIFSNFKIFQEVDEKMVEREKIMIKEFKDSYDEQTHLKILSKKNKKIYRFSSMVITKKAWGIVREICYLPPYSEVVMCKKLLKDVKIHICKDFLLSHRIHENQESSKTRKKQII